MRILAVDPGDRWGTAEYIDGVVWLLEGRMRGRSPADKKRRLAELLRLEAYGDTDYPFDLLLLERPVPPGPGRSVLGTISLAMTAGVWAGVCACAELEIVTPSSWNTKGTGAMRAEKMLQKFEVRCGPDAKSALGLLLWKLRELGEDVGSVHGTEA